MDLVFYHIRCVFIFLALFIGFPIGAQNQHRCLPMEGLIPDSIQMKRHTFLSQLRITNDQSIKFRSADTLYIPVVFHVVFNNPEENISEEKIFQQLDRLNLDFAFANADTSEIPEQYKRLGVDSRMRFCLATQDPLGDPTSGITRTQTNTDIIGLRVSNGRRHVFYEDLGGRDIWDPTRYLNIYICDMGDNGGLGARPFTTLPSEDGVLINYRFVGVNDSESFNQGRIGTHEVGHFFNLEHPWGSFEGCSSDDGVRDTPRQFGPYFGCPVGMQNSCGTEDIHFTFMDFVNDSCMHFFTAGQVNRMLSSLFLARPELVSSGLCSSMDSTLVDPVIRIYPNPVYSGSLIVTFGIADESLESYEVFNVSGRLVDAGPATLPQWLAVPVDSFSSGMYILVLHTDQGTYSQKFIKPE